MDNTRRPPQSFEGISNMTLGQYVALVRTADKTLSEDEANSAVVELAANILPLGRADQLTFEDAEHLLSVARKAQPFPAIGGVN